jgi:hypothetical protein
MHPDQLRRIEERIQLGERRIVSILRKHGIATMRMLEQKISDAGPNPQRVDPHLLTKARNALLNKGILQTRLQNRNQWHSLVGADQAFIDRRFSELTTLHAQTEIRSFTDRMGDTAEIAVLRAMQQNHLHFFGHFTDLGQHEDDRRYVKHDPDFFSGVAIQGGKLDYILVHPLAGGMGIEIKNTREWVYPDKDIVTQLLRKCVQIDVVPVLMARRIHYSAFTVLNVCGAIIHQFYNQMYPQADTALAERVKDKTMLGYFDVRTGNQPDARLLRFFEYSLPAVAQASREKFDERKSLISEYVEGSISYAQFVGRLRTSSEPEDWDPDF